MNLHLKITNFWLQLFPRFEERKSLTEIAITERLDEFVEIEEANECQVQYCTLHGQRIINCVSPEINEFFVIKTGDGYAMALDLPYYTAQSIHAFPRGTLVVRIDADNAEAMSAGYANAVSCVGGVTSRNNVYIEDKKMLDTEYADSLVDFPRFW